MSEYRVRFIGLYDGQPLTSKPGIIKRNRPKAERILEWILKPSPEGLVTPEAWIERRQSPDAEWERL